MKSLPVQWPSTTDYVAAVQDRERCLIDERLLHADFRMNSMGIPIVRSGQTAAVFPIEIGGNAAAIRLFTVPTDQADRYRLIGAHFAATPSEYFVAAEWIPNAVRFGTGVYPAVLMPWVPGVTLSTFVEKAIDDGRESKLGTLAEAWGRCAVSLPLSRVVHGDLQHGNILVDDSMRLRLIDYDCAWVPGVSLELNEVGHPNYQHPERFEQPALTETTDVFSSYVIYVSLRALSSEPRLWEKFHNGENLLFTQTDFAEVNRRGAPIWEALAASPDPEIVRLGHTLSWLCRVRLAAIPGFQRLIAEGESAIDKNSLLVLDRAGRDSGRKWYEDELDGEAEALPGWGGSRLGRSPAEPNWSPNAWSPTASPTGRSTTKRFSTRRVPLANTSFASNTATPVAGADDSVDAKLRRVAVTASYAALVILVVILVMVSMQWR